VARRTTSYPATVTVRVGERGSAAVTTRAIIAAVAIVAAGLALYQLSRPGLLFGVTEYDDGAYFGSAIRLVNGAMPYRDFVLVQPPGFELLASPFALLSRAIGTRDALAAIRLFMPLVAAANVALVGLLVSHRGRLATLVAAGIMAVFPAEVSATHTVLLEPLLDLFCLVGAVLVFDRGRFASSSLRLLAGGAAFGFAGTIKAWALIPMLVVAIICLPAVRTRLLPYLGGVVAGFAIPTLPFFIVAPGAFAHDVVATQLSRFGGSGRIGLAHRLADLTGTTAVAGGAVSITVLALVAGLVVAAFVTTHRLPSRFEWFAIGSAVSVGVLLLTPAQFYPHYAVFFAPFLAAVVGIAAGLVFDRRPSKAVLVVAAAALTALLANQVHVVAAESARDPAPAVDAVIPVGGCALGDSSAYLITANRFVSAIAGCAHVADPYGTTISYGGRTVAAAAVWRSAFSHVDYVVLYSVRNGRIYIAPSVRAELADHFQLVSSSGLLIYVRDGFDADADAG
jgi:hypothetical protein